MPATLFVYFARLGDLVILTPTLRAVAAQGRLELLARPWARGLLDHEPWLAGLHTLAKPNLAAWEDLLVGGPRRRLGRQLAGRFERIVIFDREGAAVRRWIDSWRGNAAVVELPLDAGAGKHLVEANLAAARAAGIPAPDALPQLTVPPAGLERARARLAPLGRTVALHAGSSLTSRWFRRMPNLKGLDPGQWARLAGHVIASGAADAVVLLGSAPEGREARAIRAAADPSLRARLHDWTGGVDTADLPALHAACRAVLSVDTGPAHVAAAVGAPLLVVFGPTAPERFLPRGPGAIEILRGAAPCMPCHGTPLFRRCRANVCLTGLPDAALFAAWGRLAARLPQALP